MILHGDALTMLKTLPDESVHCCVTSPPYWGLRDYGTGKWEGGDENCSHSPSNTPTERGLQASTLGGGKETTGHRHEGYKAICPKCGAIRIDNQLGLEKTPEEYVAKMVEVFREVRRVLRKDGTLWLNLGDSYVGTASKGGWTDPKYPEGRKGQVVALNNKVQGLKSKDLCGVPWRVAFSLQSDGWYLRCDIIWAKPNPMPESVTDRPTKAHEYVFLMSKSGRYYYDAAAISEAAVDPTIKRFTDNGKDKQRGHGRRHAGFNGRYAEKLQAEGVPETRNRRSVWTIATTPFKKAHFATFPPALIEPCILAGCPEGGIVLDPFFGSGTTGLVCSRLNREYIGIELNAEYVEMARRRIEQDAPLLNTQEAK